MGAEIGLGPGSQNTTAVARPRGKHIAIPEATLAFAIGANVILFLTWDKFVMIYHMAWP